jgi:regulator of sigma E protease
MQGFVTIIGVIFAVSLLVIIHEFGHYLIARAFGMRVLTYSIGFGPTIARWRPKGSDTVFQLCAIPMLGYVQVAGMNPTEAVDPKDRGSYANARPLARFLMILAGPLANYLAAFFAVFLLLGFGGEQLTHSARATIDTVVSNRPAMSAGLQPNDTIVAINGERIDNWTTMVERIRGSRGRPLALRVENNGTIRDVNITPQPLDIGGQQVFGIGIGGPRAQYRPVTFSRALHGAFVGTARATADVMDVYSKLFRRKLPDAQLMGPVRMVQETASQASKGWREGLGAIAFISLQLFVMNLLPIPVLDGGRLLFLLYEMTLRRRPNAKVEQALLLGSMLPMVGLFVFLTSRELWAIVKRVLFHS